MKISGYKSAVNTSKLTNQDKAPLKKSYSLKTKRPIYISQKLSSAFIPLKITVPSAPKTVSFSQSFPEITPKSHTSFLLFTPKKYDLLSKKLTDELESSINLLNLSVTNLSEVKKSFDTDYNLALNKLHQESVEYEKLNFVEPYSHSKSRQFLNAVKNNDPEQVAKLLSENPTLRNTIDTTQQNAMHWACRRAGSKVIELLLKSGVNWKHPDIVHRTPQMVAEKCNNLEALAIFNRISNARRRGGINQRALSKLRTKLIRKNSHISFKT